MSSTSDSLTSLVSAVIGGAVTIFAKEVIDWVRKPELQLSLDLSAITPFLTETGMAKFVRLKVSNNGLRAAHRCEGKIEPLDAGGKSLFDPSILHWVRKYPALYKQIEDLYAPITINRKDYEFLDLFYIGQLPNVPVAGSLQDMAASAAAPLLIVWTYSHRAYPLASDTKYLLKVTVFSENAEAKTVTLRFQWDGTWDGFNESSVGLA